MSGIQMAHVDDDNCNLACLNGEPIELGYEHRLENFFIESHGERIHYYDCAHQA